MAQLEHIEAIEKRLWSAADALRANSNYAGNEYFQPVIPQSRMLCTQSTSSCEILHGKIENFLKPATCFCRGL